MGGRQISLGSQLFAKDLLHSLSCLPLRFDLPAIQSWTGLAHGLTPCADEHKTSRNFATSGSTNIFFGLVV